MIDDPDSSGQGYAAGSLDAPLSETRPSYLSQQSSHGTVVTESPITKSMSNQVLGTPLIPGSINTQPQSRRLTRSLTRTDPSAVLVHGEGPTLQAKLKASSKRHGVRNTAASLESSRSIVYHDASSQQDLLEIIGEISSKGAAKRLIPRYRPSAKRRSATRRLKQAQQDTSPARDSTPTDSIIAKAKRNRIRKRSSPKDKAVARPLRRSLRLAKPLTEFHKYPELPQELQIMIWEAAIEPRAIYLRNRSAVVSNWFNAAIQNQQPSWFKTCRISWWVAQLHYQTMFGLLQSSTFPQDDSHRQPVNVNTDIVLLEPCCPGCRAYSCTRHQYSVEDRERVRFIAVQVESPYLMASASPCWVTISLAWPNVETIYMTRNSITGDDFKPKALIRCGENDHEKHLYKRFEQWKKAEGRAHRVQQIEFVTATAREEGKIQDRYKTLAYRKRGDASDIIIG